MRREHYLAPPKEQDQLEDGLLKTNDGCYIKLTTASLRIKGAWDNYGASLTQDKLGKGLIRMPNGTYIPTSKIQEIKESEQKLIEINGNSYNAIADRNLMLKQKQDSLFEDIERMMLNVVLRKRAGLSLAGASPIAIPFSESNISM